jgi:hypothetical protein
MRVEPTELCDIGQIGRDIAPADKVFLVGRAVARLIRPVVCDLFSVIVTKSKQAARKKADSFSIPREPTGGFPRLDEKAQTDVPQ